MAILLGVEYEETPVPEMDDDAMNDFLKHRFDDWMVDDEYDEDDIETLDEIEEREYWRNVLSQERR